MLLFLKLLLRYSKPYKNTKTHAMKPNKAIRDTFYPKLGKYAKLGVTLLICAFCTTTLQAQDYRQQVKDKITELEGVLKKYDHADSCAQSSLYPTQVKVTQPIQGEKASADPWIRVSTIKYIDGQYVETDTIMRRSWVSESLHQYIQEQGIPVK